MKNIFKINSLLIVVLLALRATSGQAQLVQHTESQELIDLVRKMETNYPRLKELQNQIDIAGAKTEIAKTQTKPVVTGDLGYRYVAPSPVIPFGTQEFKIAPNSNYNASVGFQYALYDFGRVKLGIEKAEQDVRNVQQSYNSTKTNLSYQVANLYYNILFINKSLVIKDAEIAQIRQLKDLTEKRIKDGDALEYETLTTEVRLNNVINQKTDLINARQKQIILLNNLTGGNNSYLAERNVEFSRITILGNSEALVQSAKVNNSDIKNLEERTSSALKDYEMAKKFAYPNINFSGSAGFRNGFVPNIDVLKANYTVGVGVTIPIYAGDRNRKQIALAKIASESYKSSIETIENNLDRDLKTQMSDIQAITEKYKTVETQIKQAQEAENLAEIRYKNGVAKNIDVTDAQTNLTVVQLQKIQYEYQLILAQLEIKRLLNEKFW